MSDTSVVKYEAEKPAGTPATLASLLERPDIQASMLKIVPKHLTPQRLVKMALMAASRNPDLLQCTQGSLLKAVMTAAEMGLDCSGTLARGYLVPFWNRKVTPNVREAVFIPGYLGLVDICRRSGEIQSIKAVVVFNQDQFEYAEGLEEKLVHVPDIDADQDDSDVKGVYMVAKFKDGGHHIKYLPRKKIEKIRARSKSPNSGPWVTDHQAMCQKAIIRHEAKFLPMSIEAISLIEKADEAEFDTQTFMRPEPVRASLSLDDIKEGNPENHTDVSAPVSKPEPEPQATADKAESKAPTCQEIVAGYVAEYKLGAVAQKFLEREIEQVFAMPLKKLSQKLAGQLADWLASEALDLMRQENFIPMPKESNP